MRRRSRAGGKSPNAQAAKAEARKSRVAPNAVRPRISSATVEETKVAQLIRERDEAFQQQAATAEVLRVIGRSALDLPKVLNMLLKSAARLSEADKGVVLRPTLKAASYYVAASYRHTPEYNEHLKQLTFSPGRSGVVGRVLLEGKSVQIADVLSDPEFTLREIARLGDFRTQLGVPLLRDGIPIGILVLHRIAVRPFTDNQIKLVETFADQAVIAIENTRLFEAEQQRTQELTESLEQQTATSQVLQVISNSPADLEPVFETILANATRLCDAKFANLLLYEGGPFRVASLYGAPRAWAALRRREPIVRPGREDDPLCRVAATKQLQHIVDIRTEKSYIEHDPPIVAMADMAGGRTVLSSRC
jgi:hypothetical protein